MSTTPVVTQLTPQGLIVATIDDRLASLTAKYQAIFGPNINLDANTFDGMTMKISGGTYNDLDQLVEAVYDSFDPNKATGAALSRLVLLNGLTRNLGSFSIAVVTFTGTAGTDVPIGSLVLSQDGASTWATTFEATVDPSGTVDVEVQCSVLGPTLAAAGTLNTFGTYIYGITSVTNAADASVGTSQETDSALRLRRAASTATPSQGILEGLYGALGNLAGVTQVQVYENKTDSAAVTSANPNGLPPHSINAVVLGGVDQDIIQTIWLKQSAGVTLVGAVEGTATDSYGNTHPIQFDRPIDTPIYMTIGVRRRAGWPSNGADLIKTALDTWSIANLMIGDDVIWNELFTPINTVPGLSMAYLNIGTALIGEAQADINIPYNAIADINAANINVVIVS